MGSDSIGSVSRTSVVIPVRDGEAHIAEAIDSVLPQLGETDEILVVDDASTDGTRAVAEIRGDSRVRVLEGLGRGPSSARNIGLAAARGEFVAFLDHDDLWPLERHAVTLAALVANPDVDAAHGRLRILVETAAHDRAWVAGADNRHSPSNIMFTGLFRRGILEKVGGFAEERRFFEDFDCCARMREAGMRAMACDVDSLIYRHHATNATRDRAAFLEANMEYLRHRISRARARRGDGGGSAQDRPSALARHPTCRTPGAQEQGQP